ncbi:MAG: 50S ribosomal protein L30 [Candidatus Methylomirabilales bacterium]
MAEGSTLHITLRRSLHGRWVRQRLVLKGLGLRKIGQTVERPDTPEVRGMVQKVSHLVTVAATSPAGRPRRPRERPA